MATQQVQIVHGNYLSCSTCGYVWKSRPSRWKSKNSPMICPHCGVKLDNTFCVKIGAKQGKCRGGIKPVSDFVKPEYVGKTIRLKRNRTDIVRFFMECLKKAEKPFSKGMKHRVRSFLQHYKLTNAEVHAILFCVGYRYRTNVKGTYSLKHMQIDGYVDNKPKQPQLLEASH